MQRKGAILSATGIVLGFTAIVAAVSTSVAGGSTVSVAPSATQTCSSTSPCRTIHNTGSGPALKGITDGTGTFASPLPAILGQGLKTFAAGVIGNAPNGIGLMGVTDKGVGVLAQAGVHGIAVSAENSGGGFAVSASTIDGTAILATSTSGGTAVYADSDGLDPAVEAFQSGSGPGLQADSDSGGMGAAIFGGGIDSQGNRVPVLLVQSANPSNQTTDMIHVFNNHQPIPTEVMKLSGAGNLTITGKIFTAGSCSSGCAQTGPNARRIVSYVPSESRPSIEDFGKAQLVGGRAYVRIDAAFANVIDSNSDYLVFITPEGDSRGLYITQKSAAGFEVRENGGGRSNLAFDYRVVAKPFGDDSQRLPTIVMTDRPGASPRTPRLPRH
jgi:hypothetical protein